jgi:glycosyltransferase involved in cell wall biosynthesis
MYLVSVIMSTYNEKELYIREAIESILNQTYSNLEIIIVLDNPNNYKLKEIVNEYWQNDHRIIIIENERNLGLANSLNKALEASKGEYIVRMDADDIAEIDRIKKELDYLIENNYDLIGSKFKKIGENGQTLQSVSNTSTNKKIIYKKLMYADCVAHPTWLVKNSVYNDLKGYRNISTCEDYDFLLRARKKGYSIGNCQAITLSYRINNKGISRSNELKQFLTTIFLQKKYIKIEHIDQEHIDRYLLKRLTKKQINKFSKSQEYYNKVLIRDRKRIRVTDIKNIIIACFFSKYFRVKFKNLIMIRLVTLINRM